MATTSSRLVVNDLRNPYAPALASAVLGLAAARGWNVMLADVENRE